MAEQKTRPTAASPEDYVAAIGDAKKQSDAARLLALMSAATGETATMWGTGMVGFGQYHYRYASGHSGDAMKVGFAARSSAISLYGLQGHPRSDELLARLGKHSLGKGCVYVKRLSEVDESVLRELVAHAFADTHDFDARERPGSAQ